MKQCNRHVIINRSEAIFACIGNMLITYKADCFIALISPGIKRNYVRAIRNDGKAIRNYVQGDS